MKSERMLSCKSHLDWNVAHFVFLLGEPLDIIIRKNPNGRGHKVDIERRAPNLSVKAEVAEEVRLKTNSSFPFTMEIIIIKPTLVLQQRELVL